MYFNKLLIHGFFLAICVTTVVCMKKDEYYCQMSSPCVCVSVDNNNIDLAGINISVSVGTNLTLNYQPCPNELNQSTVAIELIDSTNNNTISLAYYEDVRFEISDTVSLIYTNETNEFDVILSCDPSAVSGNEILTSFQNYTNHYKVILKTSKVCGLNLKDAIENNPSDSMTYFFSFVLVVLFLYFIGGSVMNACLFNEIGINMIPHHTFWSSLYNTIKDKLCGTSMMASAYESI